MWKMREDIWLCLYHRENTVNHEWNPPSLQQELLDPPLALQPEERKPSSPQTSTGQQVEFPWILLTTWRNLSKSEFNSPHALIYVTVNIVQSQALNKDLPKVTPSSPPPHFKPDKPVWV